MTKEQLASAVIGWALTKIYCVWQTSFLSGRRDTSLESSAGHITADGSISIHLWIYSGILPKWFFWFVYSIAFYMLFFAAEQRHPLTVRLLRRPATKLLHLELPTWRRLLHFCNELVFLILAGKYKKESACTNSHVAGPKRNALWRVVLFDAF